MSQPQWKLIANLGDANPIDCGGFFVYRDETGVYTEEAEVLIPDEENESGEASHWTAYRFPLDECTFSGGVLSDNEWHPEMSAWFADDIVKVAKYVGRPSGQIIRDLCSPKPIRRAHAYQDIGGYHGWSNFDSDPLTFTDRTEVESRYRA